MCGKTFICAVSFCLFLVAGKAFCEEGPILTVIAGTDNAVVRRGEGGQLKFTVRNDGKGVLRWRLSSAPKWAVARSSGGRLKAGESAEVILGVDPALLPEKASTAEIAIEAPGAIGSPMTIVIPVEIEGATTQVPEKKPNPVLTKPNPPLGRPTTRTLPPPVRRRRAPRFGLRFGIIAPTSSAGVDYNAGALLGIMYRKWLSARHLGLDLGLDFAAVSPKTGSGSVRMFILRAAGQYYFGRPQRFYAFAGARVVSEKTTDDSYGTTDSGTGSAMDLGAGLIFNNRRFDIRLTHSFIPGGDSNNGITELGFAYLF